MKRLETPWFNNFNYSVMQREFVNPPVTIRLRQFITIASARYEELGDRIKELCDVNETIYYCQRHHSIESRWTKGRHDDANCKLHTRGIFYRETTAELMDALS